MDRPGVAPVWPWCLHARQQQGPAGLEDMLPAEVQARHRPTEKSQSQDRKPSPLMPGPHRREWNTSCFPQLTESQREGLLLEPLQRSPGCLSDRRLPRCLLGCAQTALLSPAEPPEASHHREQRLRQVEAKEFSLKPADQIHEHERSGSPREAVPRVGQAQPGQSGSTDHIATRIASPEPCAPWPPRPAVLQGEQAGPGPGQPCMAPTATDSPPGGHTCCGLAPSGSSCLRRGCPGGGCLGGCKRAVASRTFQRWPVPRK